jgi:molecular chaperone DnaJ
VRDPYQVLGVSKTATPDEIKAAFRRLAREHHPDRNPGDPDAQRRFQEINAAHQMLSNSERRAQFDARANAGPFGGVEDWLSEILKAGFGGPGATSVDLEERIELTFEEAALGCTRQVTYERSELCSDCSGTGAEPGTKTRTCVECGGAGRVRLSALGWLQLGLDKVCNACRGTGHVPERSCARCAGAGLVSARRTITVNIPAGVEHGTSQTVIGAGSRTAPSTPAGDLELVIEVLAHPTFTRDADDVQSDVSVPFFVAVKGGEVQVATLRGDAKLRVPPGTAHGEILRLKGQGVPHRFRSGAGDHLCRVKLRIPVASTARSRELISELEQELAQSPSGVFDRLKELFS